MEIVNNLGLMIGVASAVFGAGVSVGIFTNKYIPRDKCDEIRKDCSSSFDCKISQNSAKFELSLTRLESQIKDSFIRVHERLDKLSEQM